MVTSRDPDKVILLLLYLEMRVVGPEFLAFNWSDGNYLKFSLKLMWPKNYTNKGCHLSRSFYIWYSHNNYLLKEGG